MEIYKILKGGSLSSTVVIKDGNKKFVRKSISIRENREYGLVRWQSQIRKIQILNKNIPASSIIINKFGVNEQNYYYDIPYYENSLNCIDALLSGESPELLSNRIIELLNNLANIKFSSSVGALSLYLSEEVMSPLIMARDLLNKNQLILKEKEIPYFSDALHFAIYKTKSLILKYAEIKIEETLTHGNLTLENILWDPIKKKIMMIDPYGETYCETIMGDVSQLLQSTASGYEYISALLDNEDFEIYNYPTNRIPKSLLNFANLLNSKIRNESWYYEEILIILRLSQFTRMFPFKIVKNPRAALIFMMHGIKLLEDI